MCPARKADAQPRVPFGRQRGTDDDVNGDLYANAPAGAPTEREFVLLPERLPIGGSMLSGMIVGLLVMSVIDGLTAGALGGLLGVVGGSSAAILIFTLSRLAARRRMGDRVFVTRGAVVLARGRTVLRRVLLEKLTEVDEIRTVQGPVLLLGDEKEMLAIPAVRLSRAREYGELTEAVIDAMRQLDPSGARSRMAVEAGRTRAVIAQQPTRVTFFLLGTITLASIMGFSAQQAVSSRPFPMEAIGAMSGPLLAAGEVWRALSYVFLHGDGVHLMFNMMALLWLGSYLEKMLGGERVLFAFTMGAMAGALGHAGLSPGPVVGASGGVFAFFGLLAAVAILGRGQIPRWMLPRPGFWVINVSLSVALPLLFPQISWIAHLGGAAAGFLVGALFVPGISLPIGPEARAEVRPFAVLSAAALALGLVGGVTHASREHPDDDEIVARTYLSMEPNLRSAILQKDLAYRMVAVEGPSPSSVDIGNRLARMAVENSDRRLPSILDTLAVARYRAGDLDEARALLEEALHLLPAQDARLRRILEQRLKDLSAGGPLSPEPGL